MNGIDREALFANQTKTKGSVGFWALVAAHKGRPSPQTSPRIPAQSFGAR